MSEAPPRVTVGLPVHNGEEFVRQAIESTLNQTFNDFELLISDNCSTDKTEEICREFARLDSRVRYHRQPRNLGAAPNHNWLVQQARGEFMIRLMHDDLLGSALLEKCVEALDSHPDAILSYPQMIDIDATGRQIGPHPEDCHLMMDEPHVRFALCIERMRVVNASLGLVRTALLRKTQLIQPYHSSDKPFQAELALLGKFVEVPDHLFFRRVHDGQSLRANTDYRSVNLWFDTSYRGGRKHYTVSMFFGYCRAVARRREIGLKEQLHCWPAVQGFALQSFRNWAGERKQELYKLLGLKSVHRTE